MDRLWRSDRTVTGESCIFAGTDQATLAFSPEEILRVTTFDGSELYIPGRDYVMTDTGIMRLSGGRMPAMPLKELYPDPNSVILYKNPGCTAIAGGPDGKAIFFAMSTEYMARQIWVDYRAKALDFPMPGIHGCAFRKLMTQRLKNCSHFQVTFIGDSITEGLNSSLKCNVAPWQPPYPELVCQALEDFYGITVDCRNRGIGGTGCQHANDIRDKWLADKSDLLVVAYGMNNFCNMPAEDYMSHLKAIIADARAARPDTAVLLIASMEGNLCWNHTPPRPAGEYAEALRRFTVEQTDIGLADMYSVWQELVRRKGFYSLTGNGVNHPNDYSYRVYAGVVLNELTDGQYLL